jgi:hypothetical protein
MTRRSGQEYSGLIPAPGPGNRDLLMDLVRSHLVAYRENALQCWFQYDNLAVNDIVFLSKGDPTLTGGGDTKIFIRMMSNAGGWLECRAFSDWSQPGNAGRRENTNTSFDIDFTVSDVAQTRYWLWVNAYCFILTVESGGVYNVMVCGEPDRTHIPASRNGRGYTTAISGTGANVVVPIDRDLRGRLQVGQILWLIDQTPVGAALIADHVETPTVVAVSANSVTVSNIVSAFQSGTLIGLDPQNVCTGGGATATGSQYVCHRLDGTYVVRSRLAFRSVSVIDLNPAGSGVHNLFPVGVSQLDGEVNAYRGGFPELAAFGDNAVPGPYNFLNEDVFYPNDIQQIGYRLIHIAFVSTFHYAVRTGA